MLKTVLTYLELDGLLRQGTPFYAGYRLRPVDGVAGRRLRRASTRRAPTSCAVSSRAGKTGRVWTSVDPDEAAAELGEERSRIVAALGYLEQRGLVELQAADARQRYTLLARPDSAAELLDRLAERFDRREQAETGADRSGSSSLVTHDGCQVQALVGYFGETRAGAVRSLQPLPHRTGGDAARARAAAASRTRSSTSGRSPRCRAANPDALGAPRQRARFLCGITSPATSRAKLTREPLFGALADRRFADVLDWCAARNTP